MANTTDTYVVELQAKTSAYTKRIEEASTATETFEDAAEQAQNGAKDVGTKFQTSSKKVEGFGTAMEKVAKSSTSASAKITSVGTSITSAFSGLQVAGITAIATLVNKGINGIISGVKGMSDTLTEGTAAWETFEANMTMNGHTTEEIAAAKKSMQDYASATVYSASEMASAYAQLDAVGAQNVEALVKGVGGLAASASDPSQAMKSLMTQITQAAGKSTIAWQDFRIMLEQAPAGVSAVAKSMGMSTAEMVTAIQDGKVATTDFLNAVAQTGTNANFTALSTQFKTVGQAIDGAKESISNSLQPAFSALQVAGIRAMEAISAAIERLIPIINAVIGAITAGINLIAEGVAKITGITLSTGKTAVTASTGGTIDTSAYDAAENTVNAQDDVADSTDNATKSTKAQTRAVKEATKAQAAYNATALSFDVIHKLGGGSSSTGAGSDDAGSGTVTKAAAATAEAAGVTAGTLDGLDGIADALTTIGNQEDAQASNLDGLKNKLDGVKPVIDNLIAGAKELAGRFSQGFAIGLGDPTGQLTTIKEAVDNLKENLARLWNDPEIQAGVSAFAGNLAQTLGTLAGTGTRVGLDIGTNLIAGISLYVDQNKDRIKEHILTMFDISDRLGALIQTTCGSVGTIADALITPQAQQTTANVIGIFADMGMGLSELFGKAATDFLSLLVTPINDNISLIRTALDDFLQFASDIAGSLKEIIDGALDTANAIYDESTGPLINTITEAVSGLVEVLLEDWNAYVKPVYDKIVEKFAPLYEEHLKPMFDALQEAIAAICDVLGPLVTDYIAPIASVIIDVVMPPLTALVGFLAGTLVDAIALVADTISGVLGVFKEFFEWIGKILDKLPSLEGVSSWFHSGTKNSWGIGGIGTSSQSIGSYATGGQVNGGQIFMARENGMAELVGNIGGATSVMNNDQIVSAVSSGVAQAVAGVMGQYNQTDSNSQELVLMVDSEELARAVSRGNKRYNTRTNPSFAFS